MPEWCRRLACKAVNSPIHMRWLRQLLLFSYKAKVTPTNNQLMEAYEKYISVLLQCDSNASRMDSVHPIVLDRARAHCQSVLFKCQFDDILPAHGPGAVTTSKDKWLAWYPSIESIYPYSDFMCVQDRAHHEEMSEAEWLNEINCRITAVPKDSRGPRLIAVHPAEAIWIQQGLRCELERAISLTRSAQGPWPRGRVRFNDQTVNGSIALTSSASRRYATIDLKDASDRLSKRLVAYLFGEKYKYFDCCRATKVDIPRLACQRVLTANAAGKIVDVPDSRDLPSYAPMGNATTFPVQSLVYWSICVAVMQRLRSNKAGAAFVFGDDIIVPSKYARSVCAGLEDMGLVINENKTFIDSHFRESCGVDAYYGTNVTPLRWTTTLDIRSMDALEASCSLAMRLRKAGYHGAACSLYGDIRALMKAQGRSLPITNNVDSGGICEFSLYSSDAWANAFWHPSTSNWCVPIWRVVRPNNKLNVGWNRLLESLVRLEAQGQGRAVSMPLSRKARLKRDWSPLV